MHTPLLFVCRIYSIHLIYRHTGANTELESNYFKLVLESIAISGCYYMPSIHILNLATNVVSGGHKKLTKQRAQDLMDDWISTGYFVEQLEMIHFGPRAIGEFQDYLRLKYKERICICALCAQPTFKVNINEYTSILRDIKDLFRRFLCVSGYPVCK